MATTDGFGTQRVNRLDSLDTARADLYSGPSVAVPPKHLMAPTELHCGPAVEIPGDQLDDEVSSEEESLQTDTPMSMPPIVTSHDFALAFDIDGVLIRGGRVIPAAVEAMKYINGENPYGIKV